MATEKTAHAGEPGTGVVKTSGFKSFDEFFPFYMREHSNMICRRLHVIGTSLSIILAVVAAVRQDWRFLLGGVVQGYAWAWVGHFFFEKNKPATFKHPLWSLMGDFKMLWGVLTGRYRI